jgi:hypothetical protein
LKNEQLSHTPELSILERLVASVALSYHALPRASRRWSMQLAALVLILLSGVIACSEQSAVTAFPTSPSPQRVERPGFPGMFPIPPGIYSIAGMITESAPQGDRPLGNASVNAWVQTPTIGYSYMFAYGPRLTDAQGRYELSGIPPGARVRLQVSAQGYVQQCAAPEVHVNFNSQLDVQLVPRATVASSVASVPPSAPGFRTISGVVYEVTGQARRPFADAFVDYEPLNDFPAAITFTDSQGRFVLCGIPEAGNSWIAASIGVGRFAYVMVPPGPAASADIEVR